MSMVHRLHSSHQLDELAATALRNVHTQGYAILFCSSWDLPILPIN